MPRQRRIHVPGGLYHAVLRGNHRQAIFGCSDDYLCFEDILARAVERYGASLFAYCWMTNHVHIAIRVAEAPLGPLMSTVASRYARAKQRSLETTGHLFERRYWARLIDADRYLLALVRYIHLNPVRAGLAEDPVRYRWSSHLAYLGGPRQQWLQIEPVLGALGTSVAAARAAYRRFMNEPSAVGEREELTPTVPLGRANRSDRHEPPPRAPSRRCLETIVAEFGDVRDLTLDDLRSRRRPDLVQARAEIARRALLEGAANLSQVARYLNRAPSTISDLLRGRRSAVVPKP